MKTRPRAPHFLRVTQALALVSGIGLPAAVTGCGGSSTAGGDGAAPMCEDACAGGDSPYDGVATGVSAYDGGPLGVSPAYDGAAVGISPYDGAPMGMKVPPPQDGSSDAYTGHPIGVLPIGDGGLAAGPLPPPELPA